MTPREYFAHYVESKDGAVALSEATGIPYSTIAGVLNGQRGIGKALARRLKAHDPLVDEKQLVWVTAERGSDKAA